MPYKPNASNKATDKKYLKCKSFVFDSPSDRTKDNILPRVKEIFNKMCERNYGDQQTDILLVVIGHGDTADGRITDKRNSEILEELNLTPIEKNKVVELRLQACYQGAGEFGKIAIDTNLQTKIKTLFPNLKLFSCPKAFSYISETVIDDNRSSGDNIAEGTITYSWT